MSRNEGDNHLLDSIALYILARYVTLTKLTHPPTNVYFKKKKKLGTLIYNASIFLRFLGFGDVQRLGRYMHLLSSLFWFEFFFDTLLVSQFLDSILTSL